MEQVLFHDYVLLKTVRNNLCHYICSIFSSLVKRKLTFEQQSFYEMNEIQSKLNQSFTNVSFALLLQLT